VDEFALRKGRRYGTLLVDVETRRPMDILPERSADSFAVWLEERPGTQVICRYRAGVYSDGGTRGASDAVQVADRWHLWHNLGEAVERAVAQHRQHLAAAASTRPPAAAGLAVTVVTPVPERGGWIAARTRGRHAEVHRLLAAGCSHAAIAAELGLSRNTVRRFARAADPGKLLVRNWTRARRASCRPMSLTCGNDGTPAAPTRRCCGRRSVPAAIRAATRSSGTTSRVSAETPSCLLPPPEPPKPRAVTAWIMTRPADLDPGDQASLDAILASSTELAALTAHVRASAALMTGRCGCELEQWMTAADASGGPALKSFVTGLRADQEAVTAG
jgi:hypothetical protein